MTMQPNVFRIKIAADRMLVWIKENEPDVSYTRSAVILQFLQIHTMFKYAEAEAAIKSLFEKGMLRFDKRSMIKSVST